jgi:hypothetical protein
MDDDPKVAGDVAPALIGPVRRLKDGRWDWRDQSRRSLEAAAASWVVRILEDDGHRIADLWSPDYDRMREPHRRTHPELAMSIDGERAALDVTLFTTNDRSAAAGRGTTLRNAIVARLADLNDERSILGMVSYEPVALVAVSKREIASQISVVVDACEAAVRSSSNSADRLRLDVPVTWVRGAAITLTTDVPGRRRVNVYLHAPRGDVAAQVDQFIVERIAKKTAQLAPWGRGILAIVHGFDESAADLRAGFNRLGPCPLWRIYWVGASPELVELVAAS